MGHAQQQRRRDAGLLRTDRPARGGAANGPEAARPAGDDAGVLGGEFGRTPGAQGKDGRDHHPYGFSVWLAGGGVKGGQSYGATDDFGYRAVVDRCATSDLHATMLHLLGLDHTKLTYQHHGRDERLTDVYQPRVLRELLV